MESALVLLAVVGTLLNTADSRPDEQPRAAAQPASAQAPAGELPRRALFGARLAPVTQEVRDRQKLDGDGGVLLEQVFPGTSAAAADCQAGDVVLAIGQVGLTGVPAFLEQMAQARAGDVLTFDVVRDGARREIRVTLKEMPREAGEGHPVVYGSVTSRGARLRTIVTRPQEDGRHPAVLLLQGGHTCFPIDTGLGQLTTFTRIARDLTGQGYVTMRVERPGCGDSEGGPLRDVDFESELAGYKQALQSLKQLDFVDADNVFLFGHSMGGIMAPLMAVENPVRGIAVYGTASETWFESVILQRRRLASLDGTNPADVDGEILEQTRFWYALTVEKKTLQEIREQHPAVSERIWAYWVTDDKYVSDRHYTFYHQLAETNLAAAWAEVAATRLGDGEHPRVLSIWGTTDWLGTRSASAWVAEVVNRVQPGHGSFVVLDGMDHFFFRAATPEESYGYFRPAAGAPPAEFHPVILETLRAWFEETAGRTAKKA